jgi:hypothetical protein
MLISAPPAIQITRPTDYAVQREVLVGDLLNNGGGGGLKALLSIGFDAHDGRLRECLSAAIDEMERYTGRILLPATVSVSYVRFYDSMRLPYGGSATGATVTDLAGLALVLPAVVTDSLTGDFPYGIVLTYSVGYVAGEMPAAIREGLLWNAANSFDYGDRNWKKKAMDYRLNTWAS